jgi:predicted secreted Zn-dependent protease
MTVHAHTITVWTPEWVEEGSANQFEQTAWDLGQRSLNDHENGHVEIDKQGAQQMHDSLKGTTTTGKGKTPNEAQTNARKAENHKLNQKEQQSKKETADKNADYDRRTQHGKRQYNPQK